VVAVTSLPGADWLADGQAASYAETVKRYVVAGVSPVKVNVVWPVPRAAAPSVAVLLGADALPAASLARTANAKGGRLAGR
jgi:hypothetical protein